MYYYSRKQYFSRYLVQRPCIRYFTEGYTTVRRRTITLSVPREVLETLIQLRSTSLSETIISYSKFPRPSQLDRGSSSRLSEESKRPRTTILSALALSRVPSIYQLSIVRGSTFRLGASLYQPIILQRSLLVSTPSIRFYQYYAFAFRTIEQKYQEATNRVSLILERYQRWPLYTSQYSQVYYSTNTLVSLLSLPTVRTTKSKIPKSFQTNSSISPRELISYRFLRLATPISTSPANRGSSNWGTLQQNCSREVLPRSRITVI